MAKLKRKRKKLFEANDFKIHELRYVVDTRTLVLRMSWGQTETIHAPGAPDDPKGVEVERFTPLLDRVLVFSPTTIPPLPPKLQAHLNAIVEFIAKRLEQEMEEV